MTFHFKRALAAALSLLLACSLFACALPSPVPVADGSPAVASDFVPSGSEASPSSGTYVVDTTDMAGNAVRLSAYPERIYVLDPGDCEILFSLGAGANIVGRSLSCDYPAEVNLLPYATANGKNDPDVLLLREPQLVVMGTEDAADEKLISALKEANVPILVTNVTDINNMYGAIALLGTVTNHVTEANALVSQLITSIAALQSQFSQHADTVYLELTPLKKGMTTLGGGTFFSSLIALVGFHNEFEDQTGLISVTQDQVVGRSPDVILTVLKEVPVVSDATQQDPAASPDPNAATEEDTATISGVAEILSRSEWTTVDAVTNNRVYYFDPGLITRAGPRVIDAIHALMSALYQSTQPEFQ